MASFAAPAATIMTQELANRQHRAYFRPYFNGGGYYDKWYDYGTRETISNKHFDGGNLLFFDDHVKWRPYVSLRSGEFGLMPDQPWSITNSQSADGGGNFQRNPNIIGQ